MPAHEKVEKYHKIVYNDYGDCYKKKSFILLGLLLLAIIIVMNFVPRHPSEEEYMKYLGKYNQDFVIKGMFLC